MVQAYPEVEGVPELEFSPQCCERLRRDGAVLRRRAAQEHIVPHITGEVLGLHPHTCVTEQGLSAPRHTGETQLQSYRYVFRCGRVANREAQHNNKQETKQKLDHRPQEGGASSSRQRTCFAVHVSALQQVRDSVVGHVDGGV